MRFGLPYKGSKNAIATWIVDSLPLAETLVDLFCGGGAVTHAAMLSGKYSRIIMNDIDGRLPVFFRDCIAGRYTTETHTKWISRTQFNVEKSDDAYIALCWSFGNNGRDYLYGRHIEAFKRAYHNCVFENRPELLREFGYDIKPIESKSAIARYYAYKKQVREQTKPEQYGKHDYDLDHIVRQIEIERLQRLQRLQSLQGLQGLQSLQGDYREVKIPDGAVIYCDIPYEGTNCGKYAGFNHSEFYEWAEKQDNIFISEYNMPFPFTEIARKRKTILSAAKGTCGTADEIIWTNPRTAKKHRGISGGQYTLFSG